MSRRLTDQVSVEELLKMREAGMTNRDIANSLGVSYPTIHRLIGDQPGRNFGREKSPDGKAKEAPKPAALAITSRTIYLEGKAADYLVDTKSGTVVLQVKGSGDSVSISFDMWETFSLEAQEIQRHLSIDRPEVW